MNGRVCGRIFIQTILGTCAINLCLLVLSYTGIMTENYQPNIAWFPILNYHFCGFVTAFLSYDHIAVSSFASVAPPPPRKRE